MPAETAEDRVAEILSPHLTGAPDADEIVRRVIEASRGPIYDRLMAHLDGDQGTPMADGSRGHDLRLDMGRAALIAQIDEVKREARAAAIEEAAQVALREATERYAVADDPAAEAHYRQAQGYCGHQARQLVNLIRALTDTPPQPEPRPASADRRVGKPWHGMIPRPNRRAGDKQPEPEWIPWHGGPRPIAPEALVEVRLRSGEVLSSSLSTASMWPWQHRGRPDDVMAYRIMPSERP